MPRAGNKQHQLTAPVQIVEQMDDGRLLCPAPHVVQKPPEDQPALGSRGTSCTSAGENTAQSADRFVAQLASAINGTLAADDTDKWGVSDPAGGAGATYRAG